jgi:hypothetical protein
MNLTYDADLIESLVFLETRRLAGNGQGLLVARYDRHRSQLYALADEEERNNAHFALNLKWFREFGLEDRLLAPLREFPLIRDRAATLLIRKATGHKDEGAELFVRPDARNVALAFRSEQFFAPSFAAFLRHEFCHISDLLDDAFAYEPDIHLPDAPPAELDLLRERYRILWDITIDGRLRQHRDLRWAEFQKALPTLPAAVFERLWRTRPAHAELVALAKSVLARAVQTPGATCPLCQFPTFAWAEAPPIAAISRDYPHWLPTQGCCARCAELYTVKSLEQPATLYV